MFKTKKSVEKLVKKSTQMFSSEKFEDDLYDDDFEDFEYGDEIDDTLVTPSMSLTSTTAVSVSVSPETDSAGNNLNTKGSDFVDYELMSSLESEYNYDETAGSQNYDFRLFHEALEEVSIPKKLFKNGTRSSLTFSNQRVREIERDNKLLLTKIMKNGPAGSGDGFHNQGNKSGTASQKPSIRSSAEVNRKKTQQKIDYENQILKRKLDKIASRR